MTNTRDTIEAEANGWRKGYSVGRQEAFEDIEAAAQDYLGSHKQGCKCRRCHTVGAVWRTLLARVTDFLDAYPADRPGIVVHDTTDDGKRAIVLIRDREYDDKIVDGRATTLLGDGGFPTLPDNNKTNGQ